jgi:hypothetical protein
MFDDDEPEDGPEENADADDKVFDAAEAEADELDECEAGLAFLKQLRKITAPENQHAEKFENYRVQRAYEDMLIAAYDRMARMFHGDLPEFPDTSNLPSEPR